MRLQNHYDQRLEDAEKLLRSEISSIRAEVEAIRLLKTHDMSALETRINAAIAAVDATVQRSEQHFEKRIDVLNAVIDEMRIDITKTITQNELNERTQSVEAVNLEKRLETIGNFQLQMKDQQGLFVTRGELKATSAQIESIADRLDLRVKHLEEGAANTSGRLWAIGVVFTAANAVLTWVLSDGIHLTR